MKQCVGDLLGLTRIRAAEFARQSADSLRQGLRAAHVSGSGGDAQNRKRGHSPAFAAVFVGSASFAFLRSASTSHSRTNFTPATIKRAMAFGTVVASYTISDFSLAGLQAIDREAIDERWNQFKQAMSF